MPWDVLLGAQLPTQNFKETIFSSKESTANLSQLKWTCQLAYTFIFLSPLLGVLLSLLVRSFFLLQPLLLSDSTLGLWILTSSYRPLCLFSIWSRETLFNCQDQVFLNEFPKDGIQKQMKYLQLFSLSQKHSQSDFETAINFKLKGISSQVSNLESFLCQIPASTPPSHKKIGSLERALLNIKKCSCIHFLLSWSQGMRRLLWL